MGLAGIVLAAAWLGGCADFDQASGDAGPTASERDGGPGSGGDDGSVTVDADVEAERHVVFIEVEDGSSDADPGAPLTFAHVFAPGDVPRGRTLAARVEGVEVPLQVDAKARHADGSLRHAVLTLRGVPVPAHGSVQVDLVAISEREPGAPVSLDALLATDFDAEVELSLAGRAWTASARSLLEAARGGRGEAISWLEGPEASEWIVSAPVRAGESAHPHLAARFSVRAFAGLERVRVAVVVENDWTYAPGPQNYTYDARVRVGGEEVFREDDLHQHRQTRWRETFWWGEAPRSRVRHDAAYLVETGALPHYDTSVVISEATLDRVQASWETLDMGPMGIGPMMAYMPTTGAHPDIGPLPQWDARCLLSMDARACDMSLRIADLAGSWPIHYRDQGTGLPVSIADYPYLGINGTPGDHTNPTTHTSEGLPACAEGADCERSPYSPDDAHQPSLAYLAYVLGGDYDHLEELHFWSTFNQVLANPAYRGFDRGLLKWQQVRGEAWSLRSLGYTAYITPDADPMKDYFVGLLTNNIEFYVAEHVTAEPNALGFMVTSPYLTPYEDGLALAPWMDDFFTWSVGQVVAMGFEDARPLLEWKARFPVGRIVDPGFCWILGAAYSMRVRPAAGEPFYGTFAEVYGATADPAVASLECGSEAMGSALGLRAGEMTGYSSSPTGYPSNLQPALAVAVESGIEGAAAAWERFRSRPVVCDYSDAPQFAITPRARP